MNEKIKFPPLGEYPSDVIGHIKDTISRYSIALVILDSNDNHQKAASGTLISIQGQLAILTARHVIDAIEYNLGIALDISIIHKFILERECLRFVCAPKGVKEESGPDIGLIYINSPKLDTIKAKKSFFNLDNHSATIHKEFDIPKKGLWVVFGVPHKLSNIKKEHANFAGRYYITGKKPEQYEKNGYDYYDIDFRSSPPDLVPSSLEGMSGGGVWHIKIFFNPDTGRVYVRDDIDWFVLSGVNFWQSSVSDGGRNLRAHGRRSIYKRLYELE